jgi:hypothetical protein
VSIIFKRVLLILLLIFSINGCGSVNYANLHTIEDNPKISKLTKMLIELGGNPNEARELAVLAVSHSKELANEYHLVSPPLYHNFLVNSGKRKRGLCFHFVEDLTKEIKSRNFKSFDFRWGRANADKLNEHNVIVVLKKGSKDFKNGIILDAWRHSGKLYFTKVKDDPEYNFVPWAEGDRRMATY